MSVEDCIFCKIISGRIPATRIYEDEVVLAFLDIEPISDGHTLVISKEHFDRLDECPDEVLARITGRLSRIAKAVSAGMNSDGYNVLCNNGRAAGQLVDHLHFHIVPRNTGDGLFDRWPGYKYKQGQAEEIAEKVRRNL